MVRGKILTRHPRSIHGGEETPEGQSSLRQGARKRSSGAPDLGSAAAVNRGEIAKKGSVLEGFASRRIYRRRGSARGGPGALGTPMARRGARRVAAWAPLAPLWPLSGSSRSFVCADFLSEFSRIFGALFIRGKTEIEKQQKTGTGTVVH